MYLFIYIDGTVRQVHDNITVADLITVKAKKLTIITVVQDKFVRFVIDEDKLCPVPIPEAKIMRTKEMRLHHI
jgi:hypothetical protein